MAILGESDFNVENINTSTIRLDDQTDKFLSGGGVAPLRTSYSDTNGDGYLDLVMQFSNSSLLGVLDKDALNSGANTIYIFAQENDGDTFLGAQQAGDPIKIN